MKQDVYQRVTDKIVSELEKGARPWQQPWDHTNMEGRIVRPLRANGIPYQGINVLMLWSETLDKGFTTAHWMTFKQALELNAHVRKGEKGTQVVFASKMTRTETDSETGEESGRNISFLKTYTVFNAQQIEGLPEHFYAQPKPREPLARIGHAEEFVQATRATVTHSGPRALYAQGPDCILMPPFDSFRDAVAYYSVLIHELTHWTKHPKRLDRDFGRKRFGDQGYAMEELVAELGAAFLCADLGLVPEPRPEHAAYIATWLKVLKSDKRAIFTAASYAQRAADFLHGLQPQAAFDPEPEESLAA